MADLDLAGIITRVCSDLKSKFAAFTHTHATSDIISGVLSFDRLPVGAQANQVAAGNHMHGFLSQTGALPVTGVTISSGDSLVIRDSSSSNMIVGTTIGFGTSTTTFLANNGTWQAALPTVTTTDNGKVLQVVNGAWAASSLPSASGVGF